MSYTIHTVESAPAAAKDTLSAVKQGIGFVPNMMAMMAEAPALVTAYRTLSGLFDQTSFSASERQVILLTASYENNCAYCVAAHSAIASMQKVPDDVVQSIRNNKPISDPKLEALRNFTSVMVNSRGWPSATATEAFLSAGFSQANILEVILGVGFKTLSNYTTHVTDTPLDQAFAPLAWTKAA